MMSAEDWANSEPDSDTEVNHTDGPSDQSTADTTALAKAGKEVSNHGESTEDSTYPRFFR